MTDDKPSDGILTGCGPKAELEQFMECPVCSKFFDMRKLDKVMEHVHGGRLKW